MLKFYFFRFFLFIYSITFSAIIFILTINEVLVGIIEGGNSFQFIIFKIIDFIILFWDLAICLSFIITFCIFFIKFSKNFEFVALRSLGISYRKIYIPIFYFSVFCGVLIYINQSYIAPYRQAKLLKNYENFSSQWLIDEHKISYFQREASEFIQFFFKLPSTKIEKIYFFEKNKKKEIKIFNDLVVEKEFFVSPDFLKQQQQDFLEVKNFFYLTFGDLYPLVKKKNALFSYIFYQKIADMLIPIFLFFIFLGKPLNPRNTDLEKKMVFRTSFCVLFLLTNQVGVFLFKANNSYPFFYAFFNHIIWGIILAVRFIKNEKY